MRRRLAARRRRLIAAALVLGSIVPLSACDPVGPEQLRDVEGVDYRDPDAVHFYGNVDKFPNISVLCIEGTAIATTTRGGNSAAFLVPSLDDTCPA